jgi:hypothetical protein
MKRALMLSTALAFVGTAAWAQQPSQQMITKDQYTANEIANKAVTIGNLLDEIAKLEAKNKALEAKAAEAAKPADADAKK